MSEKNKPVKSLDEEQYPCHKTWFNRSDNCVETYFKLKNIIWNVSAKCQYLTLSILDNTSSNFHSSKQITMLHTCFIQHPSQFSLVCKVTLYTTKKNFNFCCLSHTLWSFCEVQCNNKPPLYPCIWTALWITKCCNPPGWNTPSRVFDTVRNSWLQKCV